MNFSLTMPQKTVFGCGTAQTLPDLAAGYGKRILFVINPPLRDMAERLRDRMTSEGITVSVYDGVTGEPTPQMVHQAADLAREGGCQCVIGLGGGSAMDTAKAAAALAVNGGNVTEYLEGVGTGRQIQADPLPFIALPTTSGTGAEATKNAVISDLSQGYKSSFRSEKLLARIAVVDPELTVGAPPTVTAYSGMDALTQLVEAYLSKRAQPVTDALALSGIPRAAASLLRAYRDGGDLEAREGMAYASYLSGVCLANAGLGAVHGIAAGLGAVAGAPHGLACAILLPHVLQINMPYAADKAEPLCRALTGRAWPQADDNVREVTDFVFELSAQLAIPRSLGCADHSKEFVRRVSGAVSGSSMGGNPVALSTNQVEELISSVL